MLQQVASAAGVAALGATMPESIHGSFDALGLWAVPLGIVVMLLVVSPLLKEPVLPAEEPVEITAKDLKKAKTR